MKNILIIFTCLLFFGCKGNLSSQKTTSDKMEENQDSTNSAATEAVQEKSPWEGKWERLERKYEASLEITQVKDGFIYFGLFAMNGGHLGEVEGKAKIAGNKAVYRMREDESSDCLIEFVLHKDQKILVSQKSGLCDAGMGVDYSGDYINEKLGIKMPEENLVSLGVLKTKRQEDIFRKLVGTHYETFINTTQYLYEIEDLDNMGLKGFSSAVTGLSLSKENIVVYNDRNEFWCAYIDDENKVYYFTNSSQFRNTLPLTIEEWRKDFKDWEVVYH